jgi:hypothetical protein
MSFNLSPSFEEFLKLIEIRHTKDRAPQGHRKGAGGEITVD